LDGHARGRRATVELHRMRKRDGLIANHLAWRQMDKRGVDRFARRAWGAVGLNGRRVTVGRFFASWLIVLRRTQRSLAGLAAQVVFEIDEIAFDVRHSGATNNSKLHSALAAIFEFNGVEIVRQWTCALI
jgi:hypothetical protein